MANDATVGRNIEHVVVLMLENQSFDRLMGFFPSARGLTGDEYNLLDPSRPEAANNPRFTVGKNASWSIAHGQGPGHSLNATNLQETGTAQGPTPQQPPQNNGFALDY